MWTFSWFWHDFCPRFGLWRPALAKVDSPIMFSEEWWHHDVEIQSISLLYCLGLGGVVGLDRFDKYIASAYIYKFCKDSGVVMTILKETTSCTICQFCDAARWFFRNFGSGCPMYMRWVSWCPWNASSWGGRITK